MNGGYFMVQLIGVLLGAGGMLAGALLINGSIDAAANGDVSGILIAGFVFVIGFFVFAFSLSGQENGRAYYARR